MVHSEELGKFSLLDILKDPPPTHTHTSRTLGYYGVGGIGNRKQSYGFHLDSSGTQA